MLSELDETIRQVLIKEGGFDPTEVEVSFDIPNREWSGGIGKPTINCYLFDIHEKRTFREEGWQLENRGSNGASRRQPPLFFEMTYLITAWTRVVEDEHRLLWHVLGTMLRFPVLPAAHLQGALGDYGWPIHTSVAQLEGVLKSPGEFWTALENHLKPSLSYVLTLAVDREAVPTGPPVLTPHFRVGPRGGTTDARDGAVARDSTGTPIDPATVVVDDHDVSVARDSEGHFAAEGVVRGADGTPLVDTMVVVAGHNLGTVTDNNGRFRFPGLLPGRYTLVLQIGDRKERRTIMVRDPGYATTFDLSDPVAHTAQRSSGEKGGSAPPKRAKRK
jgi:hypothetical protein